MTDKWQKLKEKLEDWDSDICSGIQAATVLKWMKELEQEN